MPWEAGYVPNFWCPEWKARSMTDNGHFGPDSDHSLPDQSELKPLSGGWPEIQDVRLSKFLRTYLSFRRADQVPQVPLRSDIDPVLLGPLLSHVWLYRHDPDQDRFYLRDCGRSRQGRLSSAHDETMGRRDI
jgi:hypothetical protein